MSPERAKEITSRIAERREMPKLTIVIVELIFKRRVMKSKIGSCVQSKSHPGIWKSNSKLLLD